MTSAALKNTLLVLINLSLSRPLPPAANTSFLSPFHIFHPPPPHRCSFNFPPKSLLAAKLYCGVTTDMAMCGDPCGSWLSMLWMGNGTRAGCFLIPSHFPFLRSQCTLKYRLNSVATWAGVTFMIISEGVVKSLTGGGKVGYSAYLIAKQATPAPVSGVLLVCGLNWTQKHLKQLEHLNN